MQEIKFRLLRIEDKYWEYFDIKTDFFNQENYFSDELFDTNSFSQYTGLKDKNGVEIYEGDVIEDPSGGKELKNIKRADGKAVISAKYYKVIYGVWGMEKDVYGFFAESIDGYGYEHTLGELDELAVIGNIYENPELLENENNH